MRTTLACFALGTAALLFGATTRAQDLGPVNVNATGPGPNAVSAPGSRETLCAPGRVVTAQTAGRCCWPGQRWSDDDARCEGLAECPPGWGGDGNGCARLNAGLSEEGYHALPRVRPNPLVPLRAGEPVPGDARVVQLRSTWLIATGAVLLTATYVSAFAVGAAGAGQCGSSYGSCYLWTYTIPIVGPMISPFLYNGYDVSGILAAGVLLSASEFVGALLFAYGFKHHPYLLFAGEGGASGRGPRFAILPAAPGAQAGLTLAVSAF